MQFAENQTVILSFRPSAFWPKLPLYWYVGGRKADFPAPVLFLDGRMADCDFASAKKVKKG
jgi:hypothetical protein